MMTAEEMAKLVHKSIEGEIICNDIGFSENGLGYHRLLALCEMAIESECVFMWCAAENRCSPDKHKERCSYCKARARLVELGLLDREE